MSDIVKRTAFYEVTKQAGREIINFLPFYRVEVKNNNFSGLYQPINFSTRKIGTATTGEQIRIDEYHQVTPGDRFFMDGDIQLMKFESCKLPER